MNIDFATKKLEKICNLKKESVKHFGEQQAKKLHQRLYELQAANHLDEISHLPPPRCHELIDNRAGQLSVDLKHPYRLVFKPNHDPVPRKDDGGIDKQRVTSIQILHVEDTHAKKNV